MTTISSSSSNRTNPTDPSASASASSPSKASAVISVEVSAEGDVHLEDHDEMLNDMTAMMVVDSPASASASTSTCASRASVEQTAATAATTISMSNRNNKILPASDLSLAHGPRQIWIVTTAALPWRTGTAVNPLLRALSLVHYGHKVTLLVPWLESVTARQTLYGPQDYFESSSQQEDYIRQYCRERCHYTPETVQKLNLQFWNGVYQESFGSIFPINDICSLIPRSQADVCILEEPEHLNWFRVPEKSKVADTSSEQQQQPPIKSGEEKKQSDDTVTIMNDEKMVERLGWAHKFRHVIGILHTNYADYVRQYGYLGTSMLTATALNSLSSLVVKAYCHRVIRLSATLPHLDDETKEVTANVHGVRQEFLEAPQQLQGKQEDAEQDDEQNPAAVYFIGKLIWAKGFENVLHLQEKFKAATGDYFPMDIYGNGKDDKEIRKAFFGRKKHHHHTTPRTASNISDSSCSLCNNKETDQKAAAVFANTQMSLRDQLCGGRTDDNDDVDDKIFPFPATTAAVMADSSHNSSNTSSGQTTPPRLTSAAAAELLATPNVALSPLSSPQQPPLSPVSASENGADDEDDDENVNAAPASTIVPLDIFGDLSEKTISTSVDTAEAAFKLLESVMMGAGFGGGGDNDKSGGKQQQQQRGLGFHIAPAKTRFKWRRNPIPARFLGVQDHIVVRELPAHKIFLNMSTSEVLCTTSAEALAMGKFVVLPKHPSNEFFLQFPNCLTYESMDQCVLKLQYGIENDPEPLSEQHRHMLSWEGATERLIAASAITEGEAEERRLKGLDKADMKAAKFHVDAAKKSQYVGSLLRGKILK